MKFPIYIQPDSMDCGPTCLKMVAKYYRKTISLQLLRDRTQIGKDGVNLLGISEAAESIGFRTHAAKLDFQTLISNAQLPVILHWGQMHFVVLYKIRKNVLYIADPAKGLISLHADEFKKFWISNHHGSGEGVALLLEPTPAFHQSVEEEQPSTLLRFQNIFRYILPYKKLLLQLLAGLAVGSLLQLILPFLTQSIVDRGINSGDLQFIYLVLLAQIALLAGRTLVEFIRGWILLYISSRINLSILIDFLVKLMKLPVGYFDSKHTGDILQRMNDHRRIETFLTDSSLNILFSIFNLVIFSIVLAIFHSALFIVFLITSILYTAWIIFFLNKRKELDYRKFALAAREQSASIQLIQGIQEIKLNGAEHSMRWAWERLQVRLFGLQAKTLSLNQWQQGGAILINEGKNILITFLAAKAVIDGQLTLGAMLAVQYIIGQLNSPIERMIDFIQSFQNARISMARLNEIHSLPDEEPEEKQLQTSLPPAFQRQITGGLAPSLPFQQVYSTTFIPARQVPETKDDSAIILNNISFTYSGAGNSPVLRDISLNIPVGKTTAIVGASGSGKTTLLKLLLKFYDPQQGEIRLQNISLANISHRTWRQHCGVVMQDSYIFSDTIARNIAVGHERINPHRLADAARVANIDTFIEGLPLGYQSRIGMEGIGLSAGQKQRILIARAVYRDPAFIFLDEATNSLDANNESAIVHNLQSFFRNKTVIVVAHRLSTVRDADQIIVLDKGMVKERGRHDELINLRGQYYMLVKNQLELGS